MAFIFKKINDIVGGYEYCLGNKSIEITIVHMRSRDAARLEQVNSSVDVQDEECFRRNFNEELKKLKEKYKKKSSKAIQNYPVETENYYERVPSPNIDQEVDGTENDNNDGIFGPVLDLEVDGTPISVPLSSETLPDQRFRISIETPKKKSTVISDDLKLKLFHDYISICPDPALSKRNKTGVIKAITDQYRILRDVVIEHEGEQKPWKFWLPSDKTVADIFYKRGFKNQIKNGVVANETGLLKIIWNVVGEGVGSSNCQSVKDELMKEACKIREGMVEESTH